jgi:hypothetical protein
VEGQEHGSCTQETEGEKETGTEIDGISLVYVCASVCFLTGRITLMAEHCCHCPVGRPLIQLSDMFSITTGMSFYSWNMVKLGYKTLYMVLVVMVRHEPCPSEV